MFLDRLQAHRAWAAVCLAATGLMASVSGYAQPVPAGAASAPAAEMTPNERAQRDADKVFKWILIHSDKPRKAGTARDEKRDDKRDEKPAVATRTKPAARPAEPAPAAAAPVVAEAVEPAGKAAAPVPEISTPLAVAAPAAATPPPIDTALAPLASAATSAATSSTTRVAPASLPIPTPADDSEETLQPLVRTDPKFPPSLLRTLGKGQVQVRFTVQPDGSVAEPSVVTMSDSRLRPAALAAVAQWRFAPLRKSQTGVVDLVFNLE